jgi:monoamine oxidase
MMAGRELAKAGRRVTLLEARERCGGRIYQLPAGEFGYALRLSIERMAEAYDAADPERASTLALRDEWMADLIRKGASSVATAPFSNFSKQSVGAKE